MGDVIEKAIERAIEAMHTRLGETLTVDDMARAAMYSKFHFSRAFHEVTGISPGRFLSAMRLQEAKRLLLSTSLPVIEISQRVGYASVGTFGSRFRNNVGVSPTSYRQLGGFTSRIPVDLRDVAAPKPVTVRGNILPPMSGELGLIFVGLFPHRVPRGLPVRCTVLHRPGPYVLEDVPKGTWYLLAHSVAAGHEEVIWNLPSGVEAHSVGCHGPVTIGAGMSTWPANLRLRRMRALDPPVLLALLDIRSVALRAGAEAGPPAGQVAARTVIGKPPRTLRDSIGSATTS